MCGIACSLQIGPAAHNESAFDALQEAVSSRGPDAQATQKIEIGEQVLHLHSSVLHLRGDNVTTQPFRKGPFALAYNGEIFDGLEIQPHQNDGQLLFDRLCQVPSPLSVFKGVEGPYAFVFLSETSLFWGRDPLGRRSLLIREADDSCPCLLLTSTAPNPQSCELGSWMEVPANAIYERVLASGERKVHQRGYGDSNSHGTSLTYPFNRLNPTLPKPEELLQKGDDGFPVKTPAFTEAINRFHSILKEACRKRVADVPRLRGPVYPKARVAVLFSGGLDCTVLALLADSFLPQEESIDLLNVAFENPRAAAVAAKLQPGVIHNIYGTPDRTTGRASYQELQTLRPNRQWNFVQVDVPYAEFLDERSRIIQLMLPNNTVMDISIAQALYFAARGYGSLPESPGESYISEARVLLSGLGADEQLGGYTRHKLAFRRPTSERGEWEGLVEELQMDLDRIGSRNLGRDDRIISSLGKEVRYPYLAAPVVACLASLPVHLKADYRFGNGAGDKMLLRQLARDLELMGAAGFAKRAIQFGAKSAKMQLDKQDSKGDAILQ